MFRIDFNSSFLPLVIISFLLSCCKKDPKYNYASDEVRDFIAFQPGSYWIYRDDSTNSEDSVWASSVHSRWMPDDSGDELFYNEQVICYVRINNSPDSNYFGAFQNAFGYALYDWSCGLSLNPNDPSYGNSIFKIDSLLVDTNLFYNVYNINDSITWSLHTYTHIDINIVSKIGLLKWNVLYKDGHTQQKTLIRYNTIQ